MADNIAFPAFDTPWRDACVRHEIRTTAPPALSLQNASTFFCLTESRSVGATVIGFAPPILYAVCLT